MIRALLIVFLTMTGCVHYSKSVKKTSDFPHAPFEVLRIDPDQSQDVLHVYASLVLKNGETFEFPNETLEVVYQTGEKILVPVEVLSYQLKTSVGEKYKFEDGYRHSVTKTPEVWLVQKNKKVVMNVVVEADRFYYDARPKTEDLKLGTSYTYRDPEDAYRLREIRYHARIPNKKVAFDVEGFKVTLNSTSYPAKRYSYAYKEGWKIID